MEDQENVEETKPPAESPESAPPPKKSFGSSENDWAMLTHLSGLACIVGIPSFVGPLVFWLIKKDEMPLVDRAGKEALNFHLTMLIVLIASAFLTVVVVGFITLIGAYLMMVIFSIIAGLEANKGNDYSYPLTIRLIK